MSMSMHVQGFIPPDEKFQKMLKAYRACEVAGVEVPPEVDKFFNEEQPDAAGVKIDLSYDEKYKGVVQEYQNNNCQGYEINLEKLPKDIKIIRVLNCC
jgi:hypothetical protein